MENDTATNPVAGDAATAGAGEEVAQETEATSEAEPELDEDGNPVQAAEPELEEIEFEGEKHRIPAKLKGAFLMQADYTRKTQEVAERARAFEAEQKTFAEQRQAALTADTEHVQHVAALVNLDERLDFYRRIDWPAYTSQDPIAAQTAWQEYSEAKDHRGEIAAAINQKNQERFSAAQQESARRAEQNFATLSKPDPVREWPGLTPEIGTRLTAFAGTLGYSADDLRAAAASDPRHIMTLHLAMLGKGLVDKSRATAKQKPAAQERPEAKPVPQVGGKGGGNPKQLRDDLSVNEWRRRRDAEAKAHGRH